MYSAIVPTPQFMPFMASIKGELDPVGGGEMAEPDYGLREGVGG